MSQRDLVALSCKISRSGFPNEAIFRVQVANGDTYVGAAPREYFYKSDEKPLQEDEPGEGKKIEGKILAREIGKVDGDFLVSVPDGGVLQVKTGQVTRLPKEFSSDVFVQS
jgi:hypothetical protein